MRRSRAFTSLIIMLFMACPCLAGDPFELGLAASGQKDWDLAIKYFTEARVKTPLDPRVLFNLGLAIDKSGGRELAAIPSYQAYLAIKPDADNAPEVKKRIAELEIAAESKIGKLLKWDNSVVEATVGEYRHVDMAVAYENISMVQLELGDLDAALETIRLNKQKRWLSGYYFSILKELVADGDIKGAEKVLSIMKEADSYKVASYCTLAEDKAASGDKEGSRKLMEEAKKAAAVSDPHSKGESYLKLGQAQTRLGDLEGARESLLVFKEECRKVDWGSTSNIHKLNAVLLGDVARAQFEAKDIGGSRETMKLAKEEAEKVSDNNDRGDAYCAIAEELSKGKDFEGAKEALEAARKTGFWITEAEKKEFENGGIFKPGTDISKRSGIMYRYAAVQARLGDAAGAKAAIESSTHLSPATYKDLVEILAETGQIDAARKISENIKEGDDAKTGKYGAYRYIAIAEAKRSNIKAAVQAAGMINSDEGKTAAYTEICIAQMKADDIRSARETAVKIPDPRERYKVLKNAMKKEAASGALARMDARARAALWNSIAKRNSGNDIMWNFSAYLKGIKGDVPENTANDIAGTLDAMAYALNEIKILEKI